MPKSRRKKLKEKLKVYKEKLSSLNYWKLATFVLFLVLILAVFTEGFTSFFKPIPIRQQDAVDKVTEYIKTNIIKDKEIQITKISRLYDLYIIELKIGNTCFKSYVTRDGLYLFPQGFDMRKNPRVTQPESCS